MAREQPHQFLTGIASGSDDGDTRSGGGQAHDQRKDMRTKE
jgi:hypothetical protein